MQALYQLKEGGEDRQRGAGELYRNVWAEEDAPLLQPPPMEDEVVEPPPLSACEGIVCTHDGTCELEDGYARCNCPLGYSGSYCERGE